MVGAAVLGAWLVGLAVTVWLVSQRNGSMMELVDEAPEASGDQQPAAPGGPCDVEPGGTASPRRRD